MQTPKLACTPLLKACLLCRVAVLHSCVARACTQRGEAGSAAAASWLERKSSVPASSAPSASGPSSGACSATRTSAASPICANSGCKCATLLGVHLAGACRARIARARVLHSHPGFRDSVQGAESSQYPTSLYIRAGEVRMRGF